MQIVDPPLRRNKKLAVGRIAGRGMIVEWEK